MAARCESAESQQLNLASRSREIFGKLGQQMACLIFQQVLPKF
jgi:hypothetical protein